MAAKNLFHLPVPYQVRICPEPFSGCWIWIGCLNGTGYASKSLSKGVVDYTLVHRYVYDKLVGPIPEGLTLDHLCRVRCCVNPNHLEPVPREENWRRGERNQYTRKTHCPQGHPYSGHNLVVYYRDGKPIRYCRICKNDSKRRWDVRMGNIRGDQAKAAKRQRHYSHGKPLISGKIKIPRVPKAPKIKPQRDMIQPHEIKRIRLALKMSGPEFGRHLGLSKTSAKDSVSMWELGKCKPRVASVAAIRHLAATMTVDEDLKA